MQRQKMNNEFIELISNFRYQVESSVAMKYYDINKISENVICSLIKVLYDEFAELVNLNDTEKDNFPSIDLADFKNRVCIQVTSDPSIAKIKNTIEKFIEHELYKNFDRLIIYVLTEKQKSYSQEAIDKKAGAILSFDVENDIWDHQNICKKISTAATQKVKDAVNVLRQYLFIINELDSLSFSEKSKRNILDLGKRYCPELNVELDISKSFDAISKNKNFKNKIHSRVNKLLTKINDFVSWLPEEDIEAHTLNQRAVKLIEEFYSNIKNNASRLNIDKFVNDLSEYSDKCLQESNRKYYHKNNDIMNKIAPCLSELWDFIRFCQVFPSEYLSPYINIANSPLALISGEAGIGKSHLLAAMINQRIQENKTCVFLLGQHFVTDESPWIQIRKLLNYQMDDMKFLSILNKIGEMQEERVLFVIDAINEGRGRYFWKDHIISFANTFTLYPWIGLVLSVRSSYEEVRIPDGLVDNKIFIKINHTGFSGLESQASNLYFNHYGIEPSIPLLNPEFSNPLFLRLFCEGLHKKNLTRIPTGYQGITNIINFFIDGVEERLSHPNSYDYPKNQKIINRIINELIEHKINNTLSYIPYKQAFDIAENIILKYSNKRRFLDELISEGILSKNLFINSQNIPEEGVYMAYERFEDHFTVNYLLDVCFKNEDIGTLFKKNGKANNYVKLSYETRGIIDALSIQLPERIDKELYELVDESESFNIIDALLYSLLWRVPDTIKEKTKEYITKNKLFKNNAYLRYKFYDNLYLAASIPNHFYNAYYLHSFLMSFTMADKDSFWVPYLHDRSIMNDSSSVMRLIKWINVRKNKESLSDESRLLISIAVAWLLPTTHLELRNNATQALTILLENNINIINRLLVSFESIDDPYIYEGLFLASYGAILRSKKLTYLDTLVNYIIKIIFKKEEVYPNILLRDYARNIVEYAQHKGVVNLGDNITAIRPPYKSSFPEQLPSNEEIDNYRLDYKSNSFEDHYWGQNNILQSMTTEYGRETGGYGDFGRYIFQQALNCWEEQLDTNELSNFACLLIFEKYGYDVSKHGHFDRHFTNSSINGKKVSERIGKKYQWIAFYEILARVADNFKMENDPYFYNKEPSWYQYAGLFSIRRLDPSHILLANETYIIPISIQPIEYDNWNKPLNDWLTDEKDLPEPATIITSISSLDYEWIILEYCFKKTEEIPMGENDYRYPQKVFWHQIRSYFIKINKLPSLITWLNKQHFMGRWLPEGKSSYSVFSREYYWSPLYTFYKNHPDFATVNNWAEINISENSKRSTIQVLSTAEKYVWEDDELSYLTPVQEIFLAMELQYSEYTGEWLDKDGNLACFDPSINTKHPSMLIIRKDLLENYLEENELSIFWTVLGEKNVYRYHGSSKLNSIEFSGVYSLDNGIVKGKTRYMLK